MVLALAHDVACAMLHLHSENLIHGDLKASNVLLTHSNAPLISSGSGSLGGSTGLTAIAPVPPRQPCSATGCAGSCARSGLSCLALLAAQQAAQGGRLVAKIADFGLSLSLAPGDTHVSHMHAVSHRGCCVYDVLLACWVVRVAGLSRSAACLMHISR